MKSIALFFETKAGKYLKNLIVSLGASVVLIGALFKLEHLPGANYMLTIGMCTEAFLFAFLGILPPPPEYYWERYYPNLDVNPHVEAYKKGVEFTPPTHALGESLGSVPTANSTGIGTPGGAFGPTGPASSDFIPTAAQASGAGAVESMNKLFRDAKFGVSDIENLKTNFEKFGQTVSQMKDITEVVSATGAYTQHAKETAEALGKLKDTFTGAIGTMQSFNDATESSQKFHAQVQTLTGNMGRLNSLYETELSESDSHIKNLNKFYSNLVAASESMAESAEDAQSAKAQIATLAKNLTSLNNIYGNMLSAMQGR